MSPWSLIVVERFTVSFIIIADVFRNLPVGTVRKSFTRECSSSRPRILRDICPIEIEPSRNIFRGHALIRKPGSSLRFGRIEIQLIRPRRANSDSENREQSESEADPWRSRGSLGEQIEFNCRNSRDRERLLCFV